MSTSSLKLPALHQRSRQPPPPLAEPYPWLWRCHSCHITYRVATTRRCLECSHEFCVGAPNASTGGSRKRKRGGPCKSEFDYIGWAARGAWRRTLFLNADHDNNNDNQRKHAEEEGLEGGMLVSKRRWISPTQLSTQWGDEYRALRKRGGQSGAQLSTFGEKKDAMFVRKRHDCWLHCDFPSECHHAMYQAQQEGRPTLGKATAVDETYVVLKKVERARNVPGGSVTEEGSDSGSTDGDIDGEESCSSSTFSSPPLAAQVDDENDRIQILMGEKDFVDIYLDNSQTQMGNEHSTPGASYFGESRKTTTTVMGVGLEGEYSYEAFKHSLHPYVSEMKLKGIGTPRTDSTRTTASSSSSSSLPSLHFLELEPRAEAHDQREGQESPPLSPFSLAKKATGEAIMPCQPPALQVERGAAMAAAEKPVSEVLGHYSSANDDDDDDTDAENEDMVQGFEGGEAVDGGEEQYEDDLDELLNALFNKTSPRTRRYAAMKAQHVSLAPLHQDPNATAAAACNVEQQQPFVAVATSPAMKSTSSSLPPMPASHDEDEARLLGSGDVASTAGILLEQAYSEQAWFFPMLTSDRL